MAANSTYMSPSTAPKGSGEGEPIKPTLLAFHGSGSNATIHTVQLARLMRVIRPYFNVESLEAPFPSPAGPGILPFFDGCGPFKRWLPPSETTERIQTGTSTNALAPEVENLVRDTVRKIRAQGGRVVGLIGFSQGTKVVAGLLKACEIRRSTTTGTLADEEKMDWLDFSFALSVCGSFPPPVIPGCVTTALREAGVSDEELTRLLGEKIRIPTFHVLGKQDEWIRAGKSLIDGYYEVGEGMSRVVEWDMGHHYPVSADESEAIGNWMVGVLGRIEGGKGEEAR